MVCGNTDMPLSKISLSATREVPFSQFRGVLILFDSLMGALCLAYISDLETGSHPSNRTSFLKTPMSRPTNSGYPLVFHGSVALLTHICCFLVLVCLELGLVIGSPKQKRRAKQFSKCWLPFSSLPSEVPFRTCCPLSILIRKLLWFAVAFGSYCQIFTDCQHSMRDMERIPARSV